MRFKVPQNIDIKDRIIGPLSMVQFVYAVIGFGVCYWLFNAVPNPYNYAAMAPVALFVICLDFVKINERPFLSFFLSAIAFIGSPKQRSWQQGGDSDLQVEIYHAEKAAPTFQHKEISREEILAAARAVDSPNQKLITRQ
ncbi:MAG: PrgI family protein [Candidatus Berkelbacteria bacterium]|nr:PrgI family protein [Candidatus Berkelbacteria bacterium]